MTAKWITPADHSTPMIVLSPFETCEGPELYECNPEGIVELSRKDFISCFVISIGFECREPKTLI